MQRTGITAVTAINDNNPPGSHPRLITRLRVAGHDYKLDRQTTRKLRDSLTRILDMNSSESLAAYHKRMEESYR